MFMPKYTSIIMTFSNYSMENFHSFNFHYAALLVKIFMALCREKKDWEEDSFTGYEEVQK